MEIPKYPVTNAWRIVARGLDGRYYGVVVDPQEDFDHALHLVEAYTTPESWMDTFEPDAVCIRDGSEVVMLRALQALVAWMDRTGATGDLVDDAKAAIEMALNPRLDVGKPSRISWEVIRDSGVRGAKAREAGRPRSGNPHPTGTLLHEGWDRGWEQAGRSMNPPK
jgi:hypothetical protein